MESQIVKPYKKYLIVWMDILGFKERVKKSASNEVEIDNIKDTLELANSLAMYFSQTTKLATVEAGVFSDTIVITCPNPDVAAVFGAIGMTSLYQIVMAKQRHFLRGAAVIGALYSKGKNIVFGPAIIHAMEMEKVGIWPRIVVDPRLQEEIAPLTVAKLRFVSRQADVSISSHSIKENIEPANEYTINNLVKTFLKQGADGILYIDYLRCAFDILMPMRWALQLSKKASPVMKIIEMDLLPTHRDAIIATLKSDEYKNNIEVLTKYHSLAKYHNDVIDTLSELLLTLPDTVEMTQSIDFQFMYALFSPMLKWAKIGMTENDKRTLFHKNLKKLSERVHEFKEYKIDLPEKFPQMYR